MKICFVAPGALPIPPRGWGAIENIIWDYKFFLEKQGIEVVIINEGDKEKSLDLINAANADVCHCHFDQFVDILLQSNAKLKIISTHYGLMRRCLDHRSGHLEDILLNRIFPQFKNDNVYVFALDDYIKDFFISQFGVRNDRIRVLPNGARDDLFQFSESPSTQNTVCVGNIDGRKRQYLLNGLNVSLIGKLMDDSVPVDKNNLLYEWDRGMLYKDLTNNGNSVLLSYSEAAPLVTVESLMAGLGLVISEACSANLDLGRPFINVISESDIADKSYVRAIIEANKKVSLSMRKEIRQYAEQNFSLSLLVQKYIDLILSCS